ncbi:MAG: DUF4349 domain-containing protein [Chloroflexi bacterium]|nr:MAG: DUF4349 domain-containing protein [Chloroflexota bacterium]MBL1193064.1 DUF4349 domain-containing protein [Chloroflexota bacterium]NOH10357.1 DUF4349 domain-containing protein [Chloroflexota bacterium]
MKRQTLLILFAILTLSLLLSACGGSAASYASEPDFAYEESIAFDAPAEAPAAEPFSGDFADDGAGFESNLVAQTVERIVIKNADISLVVEDPSVSIEEITALAEELGGFVVSSNLYQITLGDGSEVPSGSITIRVPAEELNGALKTIEDSAKEVLSKNQSGQDVTAEYTDLQSRLRNLRDTEEQLREIMASADKTEDVLNVFNQLTFVTEEIEVLEGQIQFYEQSAAFSAISISLTPEAAVQPLSIGGWQPVGVARDAIQALIFTLTGLANFAIYLLLFILPVLAVILLPLYVIFRIGLSTYRRRKARREAAEEDGEEKKK